VATRASRMANGTERPRPRALRNMRRCTPRRARTKRGLIGINDDFLRQTCVTARPPIVQCIRGVRMAARNVQKLRDARSTSLQKVTANGIQVESTRSREVSRTSMTSFGTSHVGDCVFEFADRSSR
jgi:hypothetical protein